MTPSENPSIKSQTVLMLGGSRQKFAESFRFLTPTKKLLAKYLE